MDRRFEEVVEQHQAMVLTYLFAIVRDRDLADDLLQETFLSAYRQGGRLGEVRNLPAWPRTVARNHAFRALRRKNAALLAAWESSTNGLLKSADESDAGIETLLDALRNCRVSLPDQQRRIVELFYDRHQSAEQIAEQLGLARKTVFQTLWLARKNLRECIQRRTAREQ